MSRMEVVDEELLRVGGGGGSSSEKESLYGGAVLGDPRTTAAFGRVRVKVFDGRERRSDARDEAEAASLMLPADVERYDDDGEWWVLPAPGVETVVADPEAERGRGGRSVIEENGVATADSPAVPELVKRRVDDDDNDDGEGEAEDGMVTPAVAGAWIFEDSGGGGGGGGGAVTQRSPDGGTDEAE
ncbi:hypothetical protein EV182_001052 [Spiromyces aspiralis]|uniref:Uncharacterized protein n=1 Tax=Spiromyces aspiralis TaxID=68401 RepID=A0ACC1HTM8_9FUNG|nr:hypothetical protein EV182_001052 [Spiromyces aspiralis]